MHVYDFYLFSAVTSFVLYLITVACLEMSTNWASLLCTIVQNGLSK